MEMANFFDHATDLIQVADQTGRLLFVNRAWARTLRYTPQEATRLSVGDMMHPESRAACLILFDRVLHGEEVGPVETILVTRDGTPLVVRGVINRQISDTSDGGGPTTWSIFSDVTAQAPRQPTDTALYNPLTQLPNRALFFDRLEQARSRAAQGGAAPTAVLLLNLDRFRAVNDSLGHDVGDVVLSSIAERLQVCTGLQNMVARLDGDEFGVILEDSSVMAAQDIANRVLDELRSPFHVGDQQVVVMTSIGIALGGANDGVGDLPRRVEVALHAAKARGKARYELFDGTIHAPAMARATLETELRRAIDHGEFAVYYQPIARVANSKIVGMEALVRWQHPRRGLLPPAEFIGLAEESGLIGLIGAWVLRETCRQGRAWQDRYPTDPPRVNVNVCMRQLRHPDLVPLVASALADTGLNPRLLVLEITESMAIGAVEDTVEVLRRLADLGVELAIDDFGTGYSSLSYLKHLPAHSVKIDQLFIRGLGVDPHDTAIVEAVLPLARALGLHVTAEGVETSDQLERLRALGCDHAQGYYFWKPRPAPAAEMLLVEDLRAVKVTS